MIWFIISELFGFRARPCMAVRKYLLALYDLWQRVLLLQTIHAPDILRSYRHKLHSGESQAGFTSARKPLEMI